MKDLVKYLSDHPASALLGLAALLLVSYGLGSVVGLYQAIGTAANDGVAVELPSSGFTISTLTPAPVPPAPVHPYLKQPEPGDTSQPGPGEDWSELFTPTPWPITIFGQYCQGGKSYTNFKVETSPAGSPLDSFDLPKDADPSLNTTCFPVEQDYTVLLNCTGPENSTVTILVGGTPFDVPFMACAKSTKEPGSDAPGSRRDCR